VEVYARAVWEGDWLLSVLLARLLELARRGPLSPLSCAERLLLAGLEAAREEEEVQTRHLLLLLLCAVVGGEGAFYQQV